MSDVKQRVLDEAQELEGRLGKLYEFNNSKRFDELKNTSMKSLLWAQYGVMLAYHGILEARLACWEEVAG
jgi:hypothetical protein